MIRPLLAGALYIPWRDIFTDYQTTDSFHSFIEARSMNWPPPPIPGGGKSLRWLGRPALPRPGGWSAEVLQHRRPAPDRLPDGYNFLITYDGEKVTAVKDGRDISSQFLLRGSGGRVRLRPRPSTACIRLARRLASWSVLPTEPCLFPASCFFRPGGYRPPPCPLWHRHWAVGRPGHRLVHRAVWLASSSCRRPLLWCALAECAVWPRWGGARLQHCALPPSPGPVVGLPLYQRPAVQFRTPQGQSLCACVRLLRRQILPPAAQRADRRMIWQFAACSPFSLPCALSVPVFCCSVCPSAAAPALYGRDRADRSPVWLIRKAAALPLSWTPCWPALRPPGGLEEPSPAADQISTVQRSSPNMRGSLRTALAEQVSSGWTGADHKRLPSQTPSPPSSAIPNCSSRRRACPTMCRI